MLPQKNASADIKAKTRRYFEFSLLVALLLVISAFKFFPDVETSKTVIVAQEEIIKLDDVVNTRQENRPPPPPRPPIPIEVPGADVELDIDFASEMLPDENVSAPKAPPAPPVEKKEEPLAEEMYFEAVEQPPVLVGGIASIRQHLVYPELAKRANIEGTVVALAYVDKAGNVTKVEIMRGIGGGCDEAAINAVMKATFTPGMQRGVPVNVKVAIPLKFKLTEAS